MVLLDGGYPCIFNAERCESQHQLDQHHLSHIYSLPQQTVQPITYTERTPLLASPFQYRQSQQPISTPGKLPADLPPLPQAIYGMRARRPLLELS